MNYTPDELRLVALSAPTWISVLQAREERILAKIYGELRNGRTDERALAEFACVRDQIHELRSAIKQNEKGQQP